MKKLDGIQQKIYEYLVKSIQNGLPPTVREICSAVGIKSTSTVHYHLKILEQEGYITRDGRLNRSIRINSQSACMVPLIGKVTAGMPILAVEEIEGYIPMPSSLGRDSKLFALRVMGESMIKAGIMDGDIVVAKQTDYAENGQIVVARLGDEATVKRFYKENGKYRLQPENDFLEPIIIDTCEILGKVVSCIRYY